MNFGKTNKFTAYTTLALCIIVIAFAVFTCPNFLEAKGLNEQFDEGIRPSISIRAAQPQEEFAFIWYYLQNMPFFIKNGYSITLPDHERFEKLAKIPPDNMNTKKEETYDFFDQHIYNKVDYKNGLSALADINDKLISVFERFETLNKQWGFKVFNHYEVVLTLYGVGGHFDAKNGQVFLKTTKDGKFVLKDPFYVIVHEMVHIGIDDNIVNRFRLNHWEKERVVDLICSIKFADILKDYKLQPPGEKKLDTFINNDSISNLPKAIEEYITKYPRS